MYKRQVLERWDGRSYAAGASAFRAAGWAGSGLALPSLSLPLPSGILAGQLPLPLAALAAGAGELGLGWALLGTALLDALVVLVRQRPVVRQGPVVRWFAGVSGALLGLGAALTGLAVSLTESSVAGAAPGGLLLAAVAAGCVGAAWRAARTGSAGAGGAGGAGPSFLHIWGRGRFSAVGGWWVLLGF
ncbi:hypothetical protein [Streptomyces bambusae]|uniref:Uncharacterized protein n=1 Tax=Streptomyces bambusae TaxID=1550616 RepID=A0ABS6ZHG2_9ACTN|nr:hypothetical protein [Streptomyces bambusae]MBW5487199.1 hypothetical protein [Streptomyces bambusae]